MLSVWNITALVHVWYIYLILSEKFWVYSLRFRHFSFAEYKTDVTVFDDSPLVGEDHGEQIRVYLAWYRRDATITEFGRSSNTGTGEVGQGYQNPNSGDLVPDGSGLPSGTFITTGQNRNTFTRIEANFPGTTGVSRIGVFYATTELDSESVTIPIIKISDSCKNVFI